MAEVNTTQQALWNSDQEQLKFIFNLKEIAIIYFGQWELEQLYWTLRQIWRLIDAKLKENQSKEAKNLLDDLEIMRNIYLHNQKSQEVQALFYQGLENFDLTLSGYMKQHGLYFREGDDPSRAALKR